MVGLHSQRFSVQVVAAVAAASYKLILGLAPRSPTTCGAAARAPWAPHLLLLPGRLLLLGATRCVVGLLDVRGSGFVATEFAALANVQVKFGRSTLEISNLDNAPRGMGGRLVTTARCSPPELANTSRSWHQTAAPTTSHANAA